MSWSSPARVRPVHEVAHSRTPLREDLEAMPISALNRVKHLCDKGLGNVFMKEIAHRINKDHHRPAPCEGLLQALTSELQVETRLERVVGNARLTDGRNDKWALDAVHGDGHADVSPDAVRTSREAHASWHSDPVAVQRAEAHSQRWASSRHLRPGLLG